MAQEGQAGARTSNGQRGVPTVSRVEGDTIIELVFDGEKRETALAVSRFGGLWNIEREVVISGETLVPYSPNNNLIRTGCVLLPSKPVHHGDKQELIADIEAYLAKYLRVSALFRRIAAHYVLLSWVYDAFNELSYLRLQGDFGTGKTRGLLTIGSILYKPFFASGASTVSPIFHILETFGGSLILDESDFRFTDHTSELVKILNNGTTRGLPVLRTIQNQTKELNPRAFRVFGPKIVAMRGSYDDPGLESRFISEQMVSRDLPPEIPIHLPTALREDALILRNRLLHFRFCALFSTKIDAGLPRGELSPRVGQIALPLLSIIDDSRLRGEVVAMLAKERTQFMENSRDRLNATVATVLQKLLRRDGAVAVSIGEVTKAVNAESGTMQYTTKHIGNVIRTHLRLSTRKTDGVFVVERDALPEIDARLLGRVDR